MRCCVWFEKCSCQVASQFRLSRTWTRKYASAHLHLPTLLSCSNSVVMNHDIKHTSDSNFHPLFPRDERQNSKHGSDTTHGKNTFLCYCQALAPKLYSPNPLGLTPTQFKIQISPKGTGADTKISWDTHPTY